MQISKISNMIHDEKLFDGSAGSTSVIDGKTRVAVILAYPAKHVRTPHFFNARCRERGINMVLVPWEVPPEGLAATMAAFRPVSNLAGMIVTVPHKIMAAAACDELVGDARPLQVANAIRREPTGRLVGATLDGDGFVAGLRKRDISVDGKRVLMVGAGGAASSIGLALLGAGAAMLTIANRDKAKGARLAESLAAACPQAIVQAGSAATAGFDIIINATTLGLRPDDPLPVDVASADAHAVVAEVVMQPAVTPLLEQARARGLRIHEGEHMLLAQVDALIDHLVGPGSISTRREHPPSLPSA